MKHLIRFTNFLIIAGIFSACSISSKAPYGSNYYFKADPKTASQSKDLENVASPETPGKIKSQPFDGMVDAGNQVQLTENVQLKEINQKFNAVTGKSLTGLVNKLPGEKQEAFKKKSEEFLSMSGKERKSFVKERLKSFNGSDKTELKSELAPKATQDVSNDLKAGIIVTAVGVILLVLGGVSGILYVLGAVAFVVGIVLILLEVL